MRVQLIVALSSLMGVGALSPTFPGTSSQSAAKIQSILSKATNTQSYKEQASRQTENAIAKGKETLQEMAAESNLLTSISGDASNLVSANLDRFVFAGGCPRDYGSNCPIDFVEQGGKCVASNTYFGSCTSFSASLDSNQKEGMAVSCRTNWPCSSSGSYNFQGCPSGWSYSSSSNACSAPSDYNGVCSTLTNFDGNTDHEKQVWSQLCGATFPSQ